jgi:IS5 family transposase
MSDLFDNALREKYKNSGIHDPLAFINDAIDWNTFSTLLKDLYHNDTDKGGRPNIPVITMVKVLFLQSMFNLVDEQAEIMIRISFLNFLDYPDHLPDAIINGFSGNGYLKSIWTGRSGNSSGRKESRFRMALSGC